MSRPVTGDLRSTRGSTEGPALGHRVDRFALTGRLPSLDEVQAVHVLAIGGAGMSAVARLFLAAGKSVSGSDAADSDTLAELAALGAEVYVGHDAAQLGPADTVVVSSAIREDNIELATARRRGLRVLHRSQALAVLTSGRASIAVAGANGKTTTTAMLTHVLRRTGREPSYAIGGELADTGTNAALGTGAQFVVEADESDGSFVVYRPQVAIVTNVQPDHLDFYGTFAAVQDAYARFAATIRPGGLLVTCQDDPGAARLAQVHRNQGGRVLSYGLSPDADIRLDEVQLSGLTGQARLSWPDGRQCQLTVPVPGQYNLLNATAAVLAATEAAGVPRAEAVAAVADFPGVRRRFEAKGEAGGVRVVDDYAHNPGKVTAVVGTGARLAAPGRLVVVFQPHLYSRTRDFAAQFAQALAPADLVVVLDVYAAREDPIPGVSGRLIVQELTAAGRSAVFEPDKNAAPATVAGLVRPGDVVITVGAGDVTRVGPALLAALTTGVAAAENSC